MALVLALHEVFYDGILAAQVLLDVFSDHDVYALGYNRGIAYLHRHCVDLSRDPHFSVYGLFGSGRKHDRCLKG